jgi:tetratricopeptide (TPR) repeat protein
VTADDLAVCARADAALQLRRPKEARALLVPVLAGDPTHAEALLLLAQASHQESDDKSALELARRAAGSAPTRPSILTGCADVAMRADDLRTATAWATRSLQMAPQSLDTLLVLTWISVRAGDSAAADKYSLAALELSAAAEVVFTRGGALSVMKRFPEETVAYLRVLEVDPSHLGALNNLAKSRVSCGDLRLASHLYSRALAVDPRYTMPLSNLALTGRAARLILLGRLSVVIVAAAAIVAPLVSTVLSSALVATGVAWTLWSVWALPAPVRSRLLHRLGWLDLLLVTPIAIMLPWAVGLGSDDVAFVGYPLGMVLMTVSITARHVWRRLTVAAGVREAGLHLPKR